MREWCWALREFEIMLLLMMMLMSGRGFCGRRGKGDGLLPFYSGMFVRVNLFTFKLPTRSLSLTRFHLFSIPCPFFDGCSLIYSKVEHQKERKNWNSLHWFILFSAGGFFWIFEQFFNDSVQTWNGLCYYSHGISRHKKSRFCGRRLFELFLYENAQFTLWERKLILTFLGECSQDKFLWQVLLCFCCRESTGA